MHSTDETRVCSSMLDRFINSILPTPTKFCCVANGEKQNRLGVDENAGRKYHVDMILLGKCSGLTEMLETDCKHSGPLL